MLHLHSSRLLGKFAEFLLDLNRIYGTLAAEGNRFQLPVRPILSMREKVLIDDVRVLRSDACELQPQTSQSSHDQMRCFHYLLPSLHRGCHCSSSRSKSIVAQRERAC